MSLVTRSLRCLQPRRIPGTKAGFPIHYSRHFSATRPRTNQAKVASLLESLRSSKDLVAIHNYGSALAAAVQDSNSRLDALQSMSTGGDQRFQSILELLAASGRPEDMDQLQQILHLQDSLGLVPTWDTYSTLIRVLLDNHHDVQLVDFLQQLPSLPGKFVPSLDELHAILEALSQFSSFPTLVSLVSSMGEIGRVPNRETFSILLDSFWAISLRNNTTPEPRHLSPFIQELVKQGWPHDSAISDALYLKFNELGLPDYATEVVQQYDSALQQPPTTRTSSPQRTTSPFEVLRKARNASELLRFEEQTGLKCGPEQWAALVVRCLEANDAQGAFDAYDQSRRAGLPANALLTMPLLTHLLGDGKKGFSDASLDIAMLLYRHTLESEAAQGDASSTLPTYRTLLQIVTLSPDVEKTVAIINRLVEDMQERGLSVDNSWVATAMIITEMRRAGNLNDIREFYRQHRHKLDERGFNAILREYCKLTFGGDLMETFIKDYFGVVNDMRLQRVPITSPVYTTVLFYIGNTATRLQRERRHTADLDHHLHMLVQTTRRVHDFLTLDASISPDPPLWNQLMNTYQRLGCFGDAYRVWEVMYLSGRYDQISINIMLDACGFAGRLDVAQGIVSKAERAGVRLDQHNWKTWVECLCRLQRFDLATRVVCVDMQKKGLKPSVECFRILYKFATKEGIWDRVESALHRHQPELWKKYSTEVIKSS